MLTCPKKIYQHVLDCERNRFYHVVEAYKGELQHEKVLLASQRMDRTIVNWYRYQHYKSN
ncbi:MAG: hypothetical protein ACOX4H_05195 [Bacillota bacterium]|jgi:hypothetical protein|nr:hypothetical protein [Clostridia bacterium]